MKKAKENTKSNKHFLKTVIHVIMQIETTTTINYKISQVNILKYDDQGLHILNT